MNTIDQNFVASDEIYHDNIHTSPMHYNAMRHRPHYPPTYIDTNIMQLKYFPEKWKSFEQPNNVSDKGRPHQAKRCLFLDATSGQLIHMSSLDTLGTRHMLDENIKFPEEDYVLSTIGRKREVVDKRNQVAEVSPGDKPYRAVEYSHEFFGQASRNWRSERFQLTRPSRAEPMDMGELSKLLGLNPSESLFKPRHDLTYEEDAKWERSDEISNVKNLEEWRPAPKLDTPFKVLDNPDKNFKYRPKVTR